MQILKYLETKFNDLDLRIKVELFLLPLLLLGFFLYFENKKEVYKKLPNIFNKEQIVNKKMDKNMVDILKEIEDFCKKNFIVLDSLSNKDLQIELNTSLDTKKQLEFLFFLENYNNFSKIDGIKLEKKNLFVSLDFKKFYIKEKIDFNKQLQSLNLEKANKNKIENISFKLSAVVDDIAFINGRWLKTNDKIGIYKISKIKNSEVILVNKEKQIRLKLYENL